MQAASLEILERAQLPPAQARAIVQAIELEIAGAKDTLATKQDLQLLRHELTAEIGSLRSEMHAMRGDLRGEMHAMRGDLRGEMHAIASSNLRQMYTAMLGQLAVLLGIAYFFVMHVPR